jgi:hypothetical protein
VSGFTAEWLALRETADIKARSADVTETVVRALNILTQVQIVDLGCGTGSNMRYLSHRLRSAQRWTLVDNDLALIERARQTATHHVETRVADLRELDPALITGRDLVTAAALLDLVSETWLARLVDQSRRAGAAVLVALNYDGRITCSPADDDDAFVRALVNCHQRTDKGFGPALGPDAPGRAEALLEHAGYDVRRANSDWILGSDRMQLQRELVAGWAAAAIEVSTTDADRIREWERRRLAHLSAGTSRLAVGHQDICGLLR